MHGRCAIIQQIGLPASRKMASSPSMSKGTSQMLEANFRRDRMPEPIIPKAASEARAGATGASVVAAWHAAREHTVSHILDYRADCNSKETQSQAFKWAAVPRMKWRPNKMVAKFTAPASSPSVSNGTSYRMLGIKTHSNPWDCTSEPVGGRVWGSCGSCWSSGVVGRCARGCQCLLCVKSWKPLQTEAFERMASQTWWPYILTLNGNKNNGVVFYGLLRPFKNWSFRNPWPTSSFVISNGWMGIPTKIQRKKFAMLNSQGFSYQLTY